MILILSDLKGIGMSRFMRVLVFFDLPVKTKSERKNATAFRNFLIKDGFYMIQFSLYGRVCNTIESAQLHEARVSANVPRYGSVRSMIVTEKQYASMKILTGPIKIKEKKIDTQQLTFF